MKKITMLFVVFATISAFSQEAKQKIQNYLDNNYQKLGLTSYDINDWYIQSEGDSDATKINYCYVIQRHSGIDIFRANTNFSIKNGEVINVGNRFISDVSRKVNSITPSISVTDALTIALVDLDLPSITSLNLIEHSGNSYRFSNELSSENYITANLVYQQTRNNKLLLAWDFTVNIPNHDHIWSVRIDALDGKMLEKNDMVISCSFENKNNSSQISSSENKFQTSFFKTVNNFTPLQVQGGSYRVVPFNYTSPDHFPGQRTLITNPENALASPNGWHNSSTTIGGTTPALMYTITRGNNVWAKDDFLATNSLTGTSPNGTASLTFDFPYGGVSTVPNTYIAAANTNLFYMNNILHDVWYQYGFNELNGNFQASNLGRGPVGVNSGINDFVYGDAQDGGNNTASASNRNNANFNTPTDTGSTSSNPRMQMYIWNNNKQRVNPLFVITPTNIAGNYKSAQNTFSPGHVDLPISPAFLQTNLVLYDDGSPDVGETDNADGCSAAVNAAALNGKIVLIRRSTSVANGGSPCPFTDKVKNAQDAGAIAVIIFNNVNPQDANGVDLIDPATNLPYDVALGMVGAEPLITIPAIGISKLKGDILANLLKTPTTVNVKLQLPSNFVPFVASDGDFDNTIVAHEYGHGISTRLAGGRLNSSCLLNYDQMGEGWSDWFALMLQLKTGDVGSTPITVATFAEHDDVTGPGIRSYPYSTNLTTNPLTYTNSNSPIPTDPANTGYRYVSGDFWATVLWDLNWAYIAKYGYDDNKYTGTGGNNKVMRLVLDGLKGQPCSPTVVDSRNALIAADQATTGGQNYCLITQVFTRRGVGLNASAGSNDDCNDQIEDFTPFPAGPNCTLGLNYFENEGMINVYPNPSNGQVNVKINQFIGKINLQVLDINGRVVYDMKETEFNIEKTLNLYNLQSGLYVLKINGDGLNYTKKLIIE